MHDSEDNLLQNNNKRNKLVEKMEDLSTEAHQEPTYESEEAEPKIVRTDADIVKELVEMKFLTQNRIIL